MAVICTTITNISWKWWFLCTASANQTKRTYLESQPFMPTECVFGNCGQSCFTPSFISQEHRSTFGFEPIREKIGRFNPPQPPPPPANLVRGHVHWVSPSLNGHRLDREGHFHVLLCWSDGAASFGTFVWSSPPHLLSVWRVVVGGVTMLST